MPTGVLTSGELGRLNAATTVDGTNDFIPVLKADGEIQKATANQIASGADAVDGPSSATDNAIARFDGTTGKLIQDSAVTVADTTGLQTFTAVGGTIAIKQGANGKTGTFTANGATPVSVATTAFTANSGVIFTLKTVGGTVGAYPTITTVTPATGFDVTCTAADTSVYNWHIIESVA